MINNHVLRSQYRQERAAMNKSIAQGHLIIIGLVALYGALLTWLVVVAFSKCCVLLNAMMKGS